jgi:hypothetical protein
MFNQPVALTLLHSEVTHQVGEDETAGIVARADDDVEYKSNSSSSRALRLRRVLIGDCGNHVLRLVTVPCDWIIA